MLTSGKQNLKTNQSVRGFTTPIFSFSLCRGIFKLILAQDLFWMVTDYKNRKWDQISSAALTFWQPNTSKTFLHIYFVSICSSVSALFTEKSNESSRLWSVDWWFRFEVQTAQTLTNIQEHKCCVKAENIRGLSDY